MLANYDDSLMMFKSALNGLYQNTDPDKSTAGPIVCYYIEYYLKLPSNFLIKKKLSSHPPLLQPYFLECTFVQINGDNSLKRTHHPIAHFFWGGEEEKRDCDFYFYFHSRPLFRNGTCQPLNILHGDWSIHGSS